MGIENLYQPVLELTQDIVDAVMDRRVPRICEIYSETGRNLHDYPRDKGGDDIPTHFHKYTCWNCGAEFRI